MLSNFSLRNLRQRDVAIIVMVLTLAAAALWYFYIYRPTQDRIAALEGEIAQLDVQIQRGEAARRNLPQLREERDRAEAERIAFLAELPLESEVSDLIDNLRNTASDAGVEFNSVSQGGSGNENIDDIRSISFTTATVGPYGATMDFLSTLEDLQRFTKITQVGLANSEQGELDPDINATYSYTVYVFTGDDPGGDQ